MTDLKIENILLDGPGPFPKVLLADFGQARLSDVQFNSLTGELRCISTRTDS